MSDALHAFLASQDAFQDQKRSRLGFLYSHFSFRRHSNPAGFSGAVAFWSDLLTLGAKQGVLGSDLLVLHADDALLDRLKWKDVGRPGDLGTVLTEIAHVRAIIPLDAFLSSPTSIYSSSWPSWLLSNLVGKPLWWTFKRLGLSSDEALAPEHAWRHSKGDWVLMANVEAAAEAVIKQLSELSSLSDRLFSPASFKAKFASSALSGVTLSDLDVRVLLRFLERERKVLVIANETIKVFDSGEPETITDADKSILKVVEAVAVLQSQVDSLEERIAACGNKAASSLGVSDKEGARSALRTRRLLTSTLAERTAQLENMSAVRLRIDNAASVAAVLAVYEAATSALRKLTPDRDRVAAVVDRLGDAMEDSKEVQDTLNSVGIEHATELDEDELEAELETLQEERQKEPANQEEAKTQISVPQTPATQPARIPEPDEGTSLQRELEEAVTAS